MKTIITTLLLITGCYFISCNQKQSPRQTSPATMVNPAADSAVNYSWKVAGCAEKKETSGSKVSGQYTELPEGQVESGPEIKVAGDSVTYTHIAAHLCCRQVTVSTKRGKEVLIITEHWFGKGCKCRCSSTISGVIRQLPKGNYQLYVVETGTDPVNDSPVNGADTLLHQAITIR